MTNIGTVSSIITWHCHNVCTIHDKDTTLTSSLLKMSPNSSWDSTKGSRADYNILMAVGVVANKKLAILGCEPAIV